MGKYVDKYASLTLVLFPIFACYNIGSIALYKYLMMLNCIVLYIGGKRGKRFLIPNKLKSFYLYAFTIPILVAVVFGAFTNFLGSFLTPLLFGLNLVLLLPHIKIEYVYKYYRLLVIFACVIFVLQELSFLATGSRFGALVPFLNLYTGENAMQYMVGTIPYMDRSCSCFVEPSHFAQYLAPFLALELSRLNEKGKFFNLTTVVITLIFVILRSGNGLFLCAIIWVFTFLFSRMSVFKKLFIILPLAAGVLFYGYGYFASTDQGAKVLDRASQLDIEQDRVSSGMIRIYRGFFVYEDMPITTKAFGVGAGGADYMIDHSSYNWMFESENDHYLNNASFFLVAYGIVGSVLFLLFLIEILKWKRFLSIVVIAAYIALSFMESFVFETRMLLYIGLAAISLTEKQNTLVSFRKN